MIYTILIMNVEALSTPGGGLDFARSFIFSGRYFFSY